MAVTVDFSPSAAGNIFFEDDGIPGNTTGQFRHSAGDFATFPLVYPADSLFLYYAAGQRAYFNLFDSLGAANLTVGKLANPATHPDAINVRKVETTGIVTMATTGSVTEWGNDLDTDIFASRIELRTLSTITESDRLRRDDSGA